MVQLEFKDNNLIRLNSLLENKQIQLLAMDFDGVIADSISECAVVGYKAFSTYRGNAIPIISPDQINPRQLNLFISTRPFIRSGEDYVYLFQAISDGINLVNQDDFDTFKNKYIDRKDRYYKLFYSVRQQFITNNVNEWIELNPLYDGMKEFLNSKSLDINIISTKASIYINKILLQNEISIEENKVHSTQDGSSKSEILTKIMLDSNYDPINTYYIDDHLDTLTKMKSTKANCLLATWGYNSNDVGVHQNNSILMIDLKKFYRNFSIS